MKKRVKRNKKDKLKENKNYDEEMEEFKKEL